MKDQVILLEKRIVAIEKRNKMVEVDKKWETSITRRVLLVIFTYIAIGLYLWVVLGIENWWLHAIVPSMGFLLSTLTLSYFKKIWQKNFH